MQVRFGFHPQAPASSFPTQSQFCVYTAELPCELESKLFKGDYIGDHIGSMIGLIEGDTRSLDYSSCARLSTLWSLFGSPS